MRYLFSLIAAVLIASFGFADTYRLNPDGTTTVVAAAPQPRAKETKIAETGPATLGTKPLTLPLKPAKPVANCPNCTVCGDKCECFAGGYYCKDGKCPIKIGDKDCPCSAVPPGYAAVYARVLAGERVIFEVHQRVGDWDKGVYDCYLDRGVPTCQLRQILVVPAATPARAFGQLFMPQGMPCIGGT